MAKSADLVEVTSYLTRLKILKVVSGAILALLLMSVLVSAFKVQQMTPALGAEESVQMTIISDYNSTDGELDKSKLLNAAQGGYLTLMNLNWLPESYSNFKEAGLEMIRIDWLTNDGFYKFVTKDGSGNLQFDFTRIDRIILPMVENGIQPFMCLSYTPSCLGGASVMNNAVPNNMEDWKSIVFALVKHYRELGYTGWYWEFWNEPDLSGFWGGTVEQYINLYCYTAEGVKEADPTAKVGGPAAAIWNSGFVREFFRFIKNNPSVPLDFVSWHQYGGDSFDTVNGITYSLAVSGLEMRDLFITEWNYDPAPGATGSVKDTNRLASYAAKKMFSAIGYKDLKKIFYFAPKEGWTPTEIFSGDSGLMTVNNHKKAIFNVFKMYNNLGSTILGSTFQGFYSKNTYALITKDDASKKVSTIIWNDRSVSVDIELTVENLPYFHDGKNIKITKYLIDENHGNFYCDYSNGLKGYPIGPSEDLTSIESSVISTNNSFSRIEHLTPWSVMQIILEPCSLLPTEGPVDTTPSLPPINIAAGKKVTASSSIEDPTMGWSKDKLTDEIRHSFTHADRGDKNMGFSSALFSDPNHTEWLYVDLEEPISFNKLILHPIDSQREEGKAFPVDFKIQGSNDSLSWTDIVAYNNYNNPRPVLGGQILSFPAATFRFVRVVVTKLGPTDENGMHYGMRLNEVEVYPYGLHGVGITSVTTSKTVVGQGYLVSISVTVENQGNYTEVFNITVYANMTTVRTQEITLTSENSTTLVFTWSITGVPYDSYTISAYAIPVLGETCVADNTCTDGTVTVAMIGDLNADGTVDILDISIVAIAFDSKIGDARYNPNADINKDGEIDIVDISMVAIDFGKTYP